jgi:hypothetical protein
MAKVCVEFDAGSGEPTPQLHSYVTTVGDGSSLVYNVTHGLGTPDVLYSVRNVATGELDAVDVTGTVTSPDSLRLVFATAPASGSVRVLVVSAAE